MFREAGQAGAGAAGEEAGGNQTAEEGGMVGAATRPGAPGGSSDVGQAPPEEETAVRVQGCEDEDKVARQLCEAATKEEDPFLRAALWEEYNEYKKIVARQ